MAVENRRPEAGRNYYPWEYQVHRLVTPFQEFIRRQTTGSVILFLTAVVTLLVANSGWRAGYEHLIHTPLALRLGSWQIEMSLLHWVNEGLMALFFFGVGLEIKREMLVGELADVRKAALPIIAALGGMLAPALIYFSLIPAGELAKGWAIPMATDIAFCVAVLAILGRRVPEGLMLFLVTLAIADDIGAVLVIAFFYTQQLDLAALLMAGGCLAVLASLNLSGVRRGLPYLLLGLMLWLLLLKSGVHATIAGILVAFCIPAYAHYDQTLLAERLRELIGRFEQSHRPATPILDNSAQQAVLHSMQNNLHLAESPLHRFEEAVSLPVALMVLPAFAFVNTGIPLSPADLTAALHHPLTLVIIVSLVAGKALGVSCFSLLAVKLGLARLPEGIDAGHVLGVGLLAGIGFTMSIFVTELSFNDAQAVTLAKTGIILASLLAGALGYGWLRLKSAIKRS